MEEVIIVPIVIGTLFLGLPWLVLHYITKWKQAKTLTGEDEQLLDELYDTARRLENRLHTVERIISADHPDFRPAVRSDEELAQRRAAMLARGADAWKPLNRDRVVSAALRAYAAMTTNAARGAVRDVSQVE